MLETFSAADVNRLTKDAKKAIELPDDLPEGWSKTPFDPMKLLHAFPVLRLRQGFSLQAYIFRSEGNGNGIIWAMPECSNVPEPDGCTHLDDFLDSPKPPHALDNLMEAIEGDETPWSYFSASIFAREASEFGALWHGCSWSVQKILLKEPWNYKNSTITCSQESEWVWKQEKPNIWKPYVEVKNKIVTVNFYVYDPVGTEKILKYTDTFLKGQYVFKTACLEIANGPGGIIF